MRFGLDTNTCIDAMKGAGPGNDLVIAATARSLNLILVTHNLREFMRVPGLALEDWSGA